MGASIYLLWPDRPIEDRGEHPGFRQDDHAYASWMVDVLASRLTRFQMRLHGVGPILSFHSIDTVESQILWTTPSRLFRATELLRSQLDKQTRFARKLAGFYSAGPGEDTPAKELAQDLKDVGMIAQYAERCGAKKMTLACGW